VRDWDFDSLLARTLKISAFIMAFLCLVLVMRPDDSVVWGFLVGVAVGMWNAYFMGRRLRAIVCMAPPKANANMKAGFALRLSIMFAVLFYVARTQWINIFATGAGFFIVPLIFTLGAFALSMGVSDRKPERPTL
jgi:Na+/pantothenate symporter